eukprot:765173-Hanusia_phi.AAC.2
METCVGVFAIRTGHFYQSDMMFYHPTTNNPHPLCLRPLKLAASHGRGGGAGEGCGAGGHRSGEDMSGTQVEPRSRSLCVPVMALLSSAAFMEKCLFGVVALEPFSHKMTKLCLFDVCDTGCLIHVSSHALTGLSRESLFLMEQAP